MYILIPRIYTLCRVLFHVRRSEFRAGDTRSFTQKLFENPEELIPTPGAKKMKLLAKSWGKGTKTIGGVMKVGIKSSKKFVLKNAKKDRCKGKTVV